MQKISLSPAGRILPGAGRTWTAGTGSGRNYATLFVLLLFFAWIIWGMLHHEMWRDEVGLWLHLRHADSLALLFHNLDYGGHPLLWPLLVYPLARLGSDPILMQCLHAACASLSALLILRYAPFTLPEKILLLFGYYLSYEYAVITRHYALGVLLMTGHLVLRSGKRSAVIPAAICLALLAETNVYGTILAAALYAGWITEGRAPNRQGGCDTCRGPGWIGTAVVLSGFIIAVVDMMPPGDYVFARSWHFTLNGGRFVEVLARAWNGLFPVPEFHDHFWNSNILSRYPSAAAAAGIFLPAFCAWQMRRRRGVLIMLLVAFAGLLSFTYLKYMGYQRHHGFFFLSVLAGYWLYRRNAPDSLQDDRLFRNAVWKPMLFVQLLVGLYAGYMDYRLPFSGSEAAVEYLVNHGLQDRPLAVYPLERVKPVAALLDRGLYNLGSGTVEKYAVFNKTSWVRLSGQEVVDRARSRLAETNGQAVFILSDFTLPEDGFRLLDRVPETAIVANERYAIYAAEEIGPATTSAAGR